MSQSAQAIAPTLSIGEITVRQLGELFSLNDLHRASGGEAKHQPALFMRLDQTQALIAEIASSTDSQSIPTKTVLGRGKAQGTYACRELVIAYAAWISAAFHLKVIRVFLAATTPAAPALVGSGLKQAIAAAVREALAAHAPPALPEPPVELKPIPNADQAALLHGVVGRIEMTLFVNALGCTRSMDVSDVSADLLPFAVGDLVTLVYPKGTDPLIPNAMYRHLHDIRVRDPRAFPELLAQNLRAHKDNRNFR